MDTEEHRWKAKLRGKYSNWEFLSDLYLQVIEPKGECVCNRQTGESLCYRPELRNTGSSGTTEKNRLQMPRALDLK